MAHPQSQIGNISLRTFDAVKPRVTICWGGKPIPGFISVLAVKATISFWPQFRSNKHWFPCKFLIGQWVRGLDARLGRGRGAKAESNKEDFPTPATIMETPPIPNASAPCRASSKRMRSIRSWRRSLPPLKVSGKQKNNSSYRTSIFFPQTSFQKPAKKRRLGDMIDLVGGVKGRE